MTLQCTYNAQYEYAFSYKHKHTFIHTKMHTHIFYKHKIQALYIDRQIERKLDRQIDRLHGKHGLLYFYPYKCMWIHTIHKHMDYLYICIKMQSLPATPTRILIRKHTRNVMNTSTN